MNEEVVNIRDCKPDWKKDDRYVYIGRGSKWGNPFVMGKDGDRNEVVDKYKRYCIKSGLVGSIGELEGKVLVCFCKPLRCHGDVLIELLKQQ